MEKRCMVAVLMASSLAMGANEVKKDVLETVQGHAILSLPVHGFERLSLRDKLLAYHLYQAAIAGRDIYFDQNHRHSLTIRRLCEQILLHSSQIDQAVLEDISSYLKMQFLNGGIYGQLTFAKHIPPKRLTFEKLKSAAAIARKNGADIPASLETLKASIFDPTFEPLCTSRSPKPGEDLLTSSANNFYERGVTMADLKGFKDRYPLNSTVVKEDGKIVEKVWRTGDPKRGIPEGRYADKIRTVSVHLEAAIPYASDEFAKALKLMVDFYKTGDNKTFDDFNIAWLGYNRPNVDTLHGFVEELRDPLEKKGAWEGTVFFVNENTSGWLRAVAEKANDYETRAPFAEQYKRIGLKPIANMVEVLIETGFAGPISWSGFNLPNNQELRQKYGSKNVLLWNARTAKEGVGGSKVLHEFVIPEDQALLEKYWLSGAEILVGFHEALGHASGKQSDRMKGSPRDHLPGYYSWLEEERADLLALHHAWDPETFKIRPDWNEDGARALFKRYPMMEMLNLAELPEGAHAIEEPHAVGGNFAIRYFMKKWNVVEEVKRKIDGQLKTFWVVRDENIPRMREAVAELLTELQRIKSEGDLPAIQKLAEEYGATEFDPKLAQELRQRKRALGIPSFYAYVFPRLELVKENGKEKDVKLTYPRDFLRQQMEWSGYSEAELAKLPF